MNRKLRVLNCHESRIAHSVAAPLREAQLPFLDFSEPRRYPEIDKLKHLRSMLHRNEKIVSRG